VDVSWESLDKTRETTKAQIDKDLEELEKLTARLSRNRKVLAMAEKRAKAKTICLLDELEEEDAKERSADAGLTLGELAEAPFDYSSFLGVTDGSDQVDWGAFDVPGGTAEEVVGSSSSSK
jgi:hypothetical protein